jgi:hypothetical protein
MKKLAVVIALILALTQAASALTLTTGDVQNPEFQWGTYSLTLSLYTDEAGEMDYLPYPAEGSLAMVRLASTEGQMALDDIRSGAKQFLLRDATGAVSDIFVWHVDGVKDENGSKVSNPLQDAFELVYFLPEGVSAEGATLLLRDSDGSERTLVQMPGAAPALTAQPEPAAVEPEPTAQPEPAAVEPESIAQPEPAATEPAPEASFESEVEPALTPQPEPAATEPEPTAQPTAEPDPDQRAAEFISQLLSQEAKDTTDPWTLAILDAGAQGVTLQDGTISFSLRSFNPGLKLIEETEPAKFLRHLYENASAYDLACSLEVTDEGGFAATDKGRKALIKSIQKAAGQSKKAFDDKKVRVALAGYLLGNGAVDMDYTVTLGDFSPLFAAQSKQTLNVKDGPHALKLGTTGAKAEDMLQKAYVAALQRLSKQEGAKDFAESEIAPVFLEELNAQAAALKKKGAEKFDFVINLDELFSKDYPYAGDEYNDFLYDFSDAFTSKLYDLEYAVSDFPDYPAVDFPKSGRVSGSKSGTQVIYKIPKDGSARFIQMRKVDSEELAVSAFIRPGEKATVRVPKGMYYILSASGEIWYGEEHLFGDSGSYAHTEDIQIKGSNYYHTITLGGVENGNMSAYGADPSEFQ